MALTFNFALEGFRMLRERPKLILFWGAALLFGNGLGAVTLVAFSGPAMATLMTIGQGPVTDAAALSILHDMMPGFWAWLPIQLLTLTLIGGAVCRAGLGEGDDRFGFLAVGPAELRILAVVVVNLVLAMAIFFVIIVVAAAGVVTAPASEAGLQAAGMAAALCVITWLWIRLSLNVPQSFATQRVDVFGSFALTRGYFWRLFTGYAAAAGMAVCVSFLCFKILAAILAVAFGEGVLSALPDTTSLRAYLTPQTVVFECLFNGLTVPQLLAIVMGAPVAAYRQLVTASGPREPV